MAERKRNSLKPEISKKPLSDKSGKKKSKSDGNIRVPIYILKDIIKENQSLRNENVHLKREIRKRNKAKSDRTI